LTIFGELFQKLISLNEKIKKEKNVTQKKEFQGDVKKIKNWMNEVKKMITLKLEYKPSPEFSKIFDEEVSVFKNIENKIETEMIYEERIEKLEKIVQKLETENARISKSEIQLGNQVQSMQAKVVKLENDVKNMKNLFVSLSIRVS
jgi:hypothetical protein